MTRKFDQFFEKLVEHDPTAAWLFMFFASVLGAFALIAIVRLIIFISPWILVVVPAILIVWGFARMIQGIRGLK